MSAIDMLYYFYPQTDFYVDSDFRYRYADDSAYFTRRCDRRQRVWIQGLAIIGTYCPCADLARSKYICLGCRRVFKPAKFSGHLYYNKCVLPNSEGDAHQHASDKLKFRGKWSSRFASDAENSKRDDLWKKAQEYEQSLTYSGPSLFSHEDLETLRQQSHQFCLKRLHPLRCCKCGEPGRRVGGAFSPPPQKDVRAWTQLGKKLANGGKFDCCETWRRETCGETEIHLERQRNKAAREAEKARRIEVLRRAIELGVRTSDEEKRLKIIRERKGKSAGEEPWTVVIEM